MDSTALRLPAFESARCTVDLTRSRHAWAVKLKIKRGIWEYLLRPVFLHLPRPANIVRVWLLGLMGARLAKGVRIEPGVNILMPWNLQVGRGAWIGRNAEIYNYAPVSIGTMSVVSQYAYLCTGTHDYSHPYFPLIWKPITIGRECWVAAGAFIGPGVTVHDGAVIGARAVVTRDMPAWMVCAGNPCKPLKARAMREVEE